MLLGGPEGRVQSGERVGATSPATGESRGVVLVPVRVVRPESTVVLILPGSIHNRREEELDTGPGR